MAAGFTVEENKIEELISFLSQKFAKSLNSTNLHLQEFYDLEIVSSAVNLDLIDQISKLEPLGVGNPAPIFRFSNIYVLKADIVGSSHIKVIFAPRKYSTSSKPIQAIAFNAVGSEIEKILLSPKPYNLSVLGKLKSNKWQERETVQIIVEDIIIEN